MVNQQKVLLGLCVAFGLVITTGSFARADSLRRSGNKTMVRKTSKPKKSNAEEAESTKMLFDLFKKTPKADEKDAAEVEKPAKKKPIVKRETRLAAMPKKAEKPKKQVTKVEKKVEKKVVTKKAATKKESRLVAKPKAAEEKPKKSPMKAESKPTRTFADLFKKPKMEAPKEDKKADKASQLAENKAKKDEDEGLAPIVAKPIEPRMKKATDLESDTKSTRRVSSPKLFGKKKAKKSDSTLVAQESTTTHTPPTKIEAPVVNSSGHVGGDFASWDDLPYKRRSTTDRMMDKLNIRKTTPKIPQRLPLPLPGPLPKPAPESASKKSSDS